MAEALLRGVIGANVLAGNSIVTSDPALERRRVMVRDVGVSCVGDNLLPAACPYVLLAVKPQQMGEMLAEVAPSVRPDAVVISIAAGITTAWLDARLGGKGRIVRAMPNTPMLVGAGMTALAPGPRAGKDELHWAERLFAASGKTVLLDEALLDAVTAVSGSGPAYFFYLIEAMVAAAVAEGLDADVARALAVATCAGAARLLEVTGEPPEGLRARVTSPGGTTQRAVETLAAAGVKDAFVRAIRAAAARSRELGR